MRDVRSPTLANALFVQVAVSRFRTNTLVGQLCSVPLRSHYGGVFDGFPGTFWASPSGRPA